jgi:predicted dehydrogenase
MSLINFSESQKKLQLIRVGVIGAGDSLIQTHLPRLSQIKNVELKSISNRTVKSAQKVADKFNIPNVIEHWTELVNSDDIDAVIIGTWPYTHKEMVITSLNEGKHVLTQARMAMDSKEAWEMFRVSLNNPGLIAQIVPAYTPTILEEKTIINVMRSGFIGDLVHVDAVQNNGFFDQYGNPFWRKNIELSGYNVMSLGQIAEGMIRLFGSFSSVSALTRLHYPKFTSEDGVHSLATIPDHVEVICELYSGLTSHLRTSEVVGLAPSEMLMFGTEGILKFDYDSTRLFGIQNGEKEFCQIEIPGQDKQKFDVANRFIDAIRGFKEVSHTTFEEGVEYMEFTEAVSVSSRNGKKVDLPL